LTASCDFEFQKRGQLFIRTHNETLSVVAMCVCNPDRLSERERENFKQRLFALAFFFRRQDRELPGAISRGLLDCLTRSADAANP
jgi:hypothetical protein